LTLGAGAALPDFPRENVVLLKTKSSFCNSFLLKNIKKGLEQIHI